MSTLRNDFGCAIATVKLQGNHVEVYCRNSAIHTFPLYIYDALARSGGASATLIELNNTLMTEKHAGDVKLADAIVLADSVAAERDSAHVDLRKCKVRIVAQRQQINALKAALSEQREQSEPAPSAYEQKKERVLDSVLEASLGYEPGENGKLHDWVRDQFHRAEVRDGLTEPDPEVYPYVEGTVVRATQNIGGGDGSLVVRYEDLGVVVHVEYGAGAEEHGAFPTVKFERSGFTTRVMPDEVAFSRTGEKP